MSTQPTPAPSADNMIPVTRVVFDLDSFDEVTLVKSIPFTPATGVQDALSMLNNDDAALTAIINDGLKARAESLAQSDDSGWSIETDEESGEVAPFAGTIADAKAVNSTVLNLAKVVFGFGKDKTKEQKKAAKDQAREFVKGNETIRTGLRNNAAKTK